MGGSYERVGVNLQPKDSGGTAARALSTLRLRAVTGARSAEGLEPVDTWA